MVHPHLRGAYAALPRQQLIFPGSSPHTWGILIEVCKTVCLERFIPTYVGHTRPWYHIRNQHSVHPHIRGAYSSRRDTTSPLIGSSPHTWGIPVASDPLLEAVRFIPTYVGHTCRCCPGPATRSVHPHIRGAYCLAPRKRVRSLGSSPHTWGILFRRVQQRQHLRFIPTYVGHTKLQDKADRKDAVHPHIRGAYSLLPV